MISTCLVVLNTPHIPILSLLLRLLNSNYKQEAIRKQYPTLSYGCFIGKSVSIEELVIKLKANSELVKYRHAKVQV
jgi:hypothetical protein